DLIAEGENGYVARSAYPEDLAAAIERVHAEGEALRERTVAWFRANAERLSLESSLKTVLESYSSASARR
ncbi:MAG TPA: glycosyltransferase family 1 protein, partial [Candidatus Limnocylindria bacterium]|nr:glycosyltransferase family 1 protein [Candidatus Limnocylindria bacterium]